jgi:hypothetical protein
LNKNILLLFVFLLLVSWRAFPQSAKDTADYSAVDSSARNVEYKGDLKLLVADLTKNCKSDREKARAVFVWIADNIAYDYKFINKNKKIKFPKYRAGEDRNTKDAEWEDKYLATVLYKGMAICDGYARLFKRMCNYAGLQTDIVNGYTKNNPSQIGRMGEENHAWNGIILDGSYYFLDVTWASGGCDRDEEGKLEPFVKSFDDYYWLTPTEKLSRDHYPKNESLPGIMSFPKQKYIDNAYINPQFISDVEILSPDSGIIDACVGDTLQFRFRYTGAVNYLQCHTNVYHPKKPWEILKSGKEWTDEETIKQRYIKFNSDGNNYIFNFVADDKRIRYVDLILDHNHLARFKVRLAE